MRAALSALLALACALSTTAARATSSCALTTVVPIGFGTYDTFNPTPADTVGSITLVCHGVTTTPPVVLQLGRGGGSSFFPRAMRGLQYSLDYNLFIDAARLGVWGDGSAGTGMVTVAPQEGQPLTVSVYGRVFAMQNVAAGTYGDSVLVTVQF